MCAGPLHLRPFKDMIIKRTQEEKEDKTRSTMVKLWSNIQEKMDDQKFENDDTISIEYIEYSILEAVQSLKDQVDLIKTKTARNESFQKQLISTLQSQIEDLQAAVKFRRDTEAFEKEITKHFENIENSLNTSKYDELFANYKEAFKKIDELSRNKDELLMKNGNLERQILAGQQKQNELIEENNKLTKKIQEIQGKNNQQQ